MNLREVNCTGAPAALRAVLLHRPDAHPLWHTYQVSLVHLRPSEETPSGNLHFPDSSHEIMMVALDPRSKADPASPSTNVMLMPPNLVHQLRGLSDLAAIRVFGLFVHALSAGDLSPDTDFRKSQIAWLDRWGKAS